MKQHQKQHLALVVLAMMVCGGMAACDTDAKKASFSNGGWQASYGKRAWDGQSTLTAGAAFASVLGGPATATAAAAFLQQMIDEQLAGAARALTEVSTDTAKSALRRLASNLLSGQEAFAGLDTMDIKAAMIRVNCQSCIKYPCPTITNIGRTCDQCMNTEGYYQLAIGFRVRGSSRAAGRKLMTARA